jgi:hypothetical protein
LLLLQLLLILLIFLLLPNSVLTILLRVSLPLLLLIKVPLLIKVLLRVSLPLLLLLLLFSPLRIVDGTGIVHICVPTAGSDFLLRVPPAKVQGIHSRQTNTVSPSVRRGIGTGFDQPGTHDAHRETRSISMTVKTGKTVLGIGSRVQA